MADVEQFAENDAWFLGLIPAQGCNLEHILHVYVFVNRSAIPPFGVIRECLSRAVRAGMVVVPSAGRYELAPLWTKRFKEIVDKRSTTEDGLEELGEFLSETRWPEVAPDFQLPEIEYLTAAHVVIRHYDRVFGRS